MSDGAAIDVEAVDAFWRWVAADPDALDPARLVHDVDALDRRVTALGFVWEVGPDPGGGCFLALSPGGVRERLIATRAAVARAPTITGWRFLPAKPPRVTELTAIDLRDGDRVRRFDLTTWQVVAFRYPDGLSELVFRAPPTDAPSALLADAADVAVIGELGEERYLEQVHATLVVDAFAPADAPAARPLAPGLLARLLPPWPG